MLFLCGGSDRSEFYQGAVSCLLSARGREVEREGGRGEEGGEGRKGGGERDREKKLVTSRLGDKLL